MNDSLVHATAKSLQKANNNLWSFLHFKQIRALCKPEQLVKYDSLVQRLVRKMGKPRSEQKKEEKK
jgi:hypothetical protein